MGNPALIACTLSSADFQLRLAAIAELNSKSLRSVKREDLRLQLVYDGRARQEVEDMINRERVCCPFLNFEIQERGSEILVLVGSPDEAREAAVLLFDQLSSKKTTCACGPE